MIGLLQFSLFLQSLSFFGNMAILRNEDRVHSTNEQTINGEKYKTKFTLAKTQLRLCTRTIMAIQSNAGITRAATVITSKTSVT